MLIHLRESDGGRTLEVKVRGRLTAEDYRRFVPEFERLARKHGRVSVLFELEDFGGWDPDGLWEDIKFDAMHFSNIERWAVVGGNKADGGMAAFRRPFNRKTIQFFAASAAEEARRWIRGEPA